MSNLMTALPAPYELGPKELGPIILQPGPRTESTSLEILQTNMWSMLYYEQISAGNAIYCFPWKYSEALLMYSPAE